MAQHDDVDTDTTEAFDEIQQHLVCAMGELFEGHGFPVELVAMGASVPIMVGETVASVIGYASESLRGALVLVASRAVVTALQPEELREELASNDDATCDVIGEFSNMLLGRLKNQLLGRGATLMLATPTTSIGKDLHFASSNAAVAAWHEFSCSAGPVYVRFEAMFDPGFAFGEATESATATVAEGDMMMF